MNSFNNNAIAASKDKNLQKALYNATERFKQARADTLGSIDFESYRKAASAIKSDAIGHLSYYLDKFKTNAQKAGTNVHYASDSQEAIRIALKIIEENNGSLVVKGKSMVTEEIGLNDALEKEGIEVTETDLGEFIIQLAGEKPSHIIAPAIHKTKEEVGKLFAVADTGTIVIVTNEGNGRMVATVPKVHIAFASVEKIIPSIKDLPLFLRLLPRAATGQKLSSYVSFLTGISEEEKKAGRSRHIIFVNNGRDAIISGRFREILHCIRCGACINVCPVYGFAGGYSYQATYPGPIGIVLTSLLEGLPNRAELPFAACTLCYACQEACSVGIKLTDMIRELRAESVRRKSTSIRLSVMMRAYGMLFSSPKLYRLSAPPINAMIKRGYKKYE